METDKRLGPLSVTTGVLTPSEYANLAPTTAAEVEELLAEAAAKPGHDAAWFIRYRKNIREGLAFFIGADLPGTGYWMF